MLVTMLAAAAALGGRCYDLSAKQPHTLSGQLRYVMFAGPPNFEDVRNDDTPEPAYVLRLAQPICISGDDFADPGKAFRDVQVVTTDATRGQLKRYVGRAVTLDLTDQMAAETGHHHEPLVAWVTAVRPAVQAMDMVDTYGTAATTVEAFYAALTAGQGGVASALMVPERRAVPAFSASGLSSFYGHLSEPLRLVEIARTGVSTFLAHYRYTAATRHCDGRAEVTTVRRGTQNLILHIKALDGC